MANKKGEQVEPGIWRKPDGKGYLVEVSYADPQTGKRIRKQKWIHRLDLAREWRQAQKTDALRGEIRRKKRDRQAPPFDRFAQEYLEKWAKVEKRESSYVRDRNITERLKEHFGNMSLDQIARRDVESYLAQRKATGLKPGTTNRELFLLKNMLRKAVDWEYLEISPAADVSQARIEVPEFEFLREAEIDRLLEVAPPHLEVFITLAVYTGMRRGELFKLEWRDVHFDKGENGVITVRDTKNRETRYIPMNRTVREALGKHPRRLVKEEIKGQIKTKMCPLVFSTPTGEPIKDVRAAFTTALRRAGIERHIRFHDLRHTFASQLVMKGVDLRTAAMLMGHRDIKMTMRYAHLAPDHLQAAVEVLTVRSEKPERRQGTDDSP